MPVDFSAFQQVDSNNNNQPKTTYFKWTPSEMPQFIGTYLGEKVITFKNETFTRLMFKDAVNNTNDAPIEGILSCKDYAQLKLKLGAELVGKRLGITWLGIKPHPKYAAKTLHTFAVCIMTPVDEDLPF